jgi:hypothetical protein
MTMIIYEKKTFGTMWLDKKKTTKDIDSSQPEVNLQNYRLVNEIEITRQISVLKLVPT